MPRIEYRPPRRTKPASSYLRDYRRNVTSQEGEDGIIAKIFELIGTKHKYCVEFGAWDGKHLSNTWTLLNEHGWRGLLIEGDRTRFEELRESYRANSGIEAVNAFVDTGDNSLDRILARCDCPQDFDLLSVDVDGVDWHLWNSLAAFKPRLVVIEFNPTIPNEVLYVQDNDSAIHHGSSLLAFIELAGAKGYELAATTPFNAFFVVREAFPLLGIDDNSIDAMHSCDPYETKLFQLFDGTLEVAGCTQLLWNGYRFAAKDLQVVPAEDRHYGVPSYGPEKSKRLGRRLRELRQFLRW